MKKILFFAAVMGVAFTSCMNEEFIGDNSPTTSQETPGAISFRYDLSKVTREDKAAAAAAEDLGYQFIVWGEKGEAATGAVHTADDGGANTHQLVFENYQVNYVTSSAMTTTSNTEGWEYVGYTHSDNYQSNIKTKAGDAIAVNAPSAAQTIKYWDWGASSYTFTAISASKLTGGKTDIENGYVTIQKNTSGTTVYDKGYTLALTAAADLDHLFFSERVFIDRTVGSNESNTDRTADNTYGGNVTFRFHSMSSKVRVAMYETIPGYSVTINSFKVTDAANPAFSAMTTPEKSQFKANFVNSASGTKGNLVVKYISSGDTKNHPTVSFTPTDGSGDPTSAANILTLGNVLKKDATLGTTITGATYDKAEKAYTSVFPKEDNTQNLKLKVCYTLTAVDNSGNATTGETITVTDATAEIPAEYLRWKPGYAYTYIFKISPNGNGQTGEGTTPAGLYPITFDAVEMIAEDGKAEYITTVSEPSITTFGYDATNNKYVTGGSEYAAGSDIYATFMEGSTIKTPILGSSGAQHVNIFAVSSADDTNFPVTEASVAEAIAHPASITVDGGVYTYDDGTSTYTPVSGAASLVEGTTYYKKDGNGVAPGVTGYEQTIAVDGTDYKVGSKITATDITNSTSTDYFTGGTAPAVATSVPGEDGNAISIAYNLTSKPTDWNALANVYYTDKACTIPANGAWGTGDGEYTSGTYYKKFVSAVKLSSVAAGTYAIEYEASTAWTGSFTKVYKVIRVQ